jgi:hypothetical protein
MATHGKTVCTCGALMGQCSCPRGHNSITVVKEGCTNCRKRMRSRPDKYRKLHQLASGLWSSKSPEVKRILGETMAGLWSHMTPEDRHLLEQEGLAPLSSKEVTR